MSQTQLQARVVMFLICFGDLFIPFQTQKTQEELEIYQFYG